MTWGWIVIDKPSYMTSMAVTQRVKRLFEIKKAGHAGTLDPLATGLLPIALGAATSLIPFLMQERKTYEFTVAWGERTTTDDSQGLVCATSSVRPSASTIQEILPRFIGAIHQIPPRYSALKVKGKPAYAYARQGKVIDMAARSIHIYSFRLVESQENSAHFCVTCSSGTYVRSLARDLARALCTEGHIISLRRTHVGPFIERENQVLTLDFLEKISHKERMKYIQLPQSILHNMDACSVSSAECKALWQGRKVERSLHEGMWACYEGNKLVALARYNEGALQPVRCFKGEA